MRYESNVRFIDTHTEGNRGDNNDAVFANETMLMLCSGRRIQAGMIRQGNEAFLAQPLGGLFRFLSRHAVNNSCIVPVIRKECQQLALLVDFALYFVTNIRSIEFRDKSLRINQSQLIRNFAADFGRCRRR